MALNTWFRRLQAACVARFPARRARASARRAGAPRVAGSLNVEALEERAVFADLSNFVTTEHVDLNIVSTPGGFTIEPRNDDAAVSYSADDVLLYVGVGENSGSINQRPTGADFDFIGVASGADFYRLPQSQNPNLLYAGFSGAGVTANTIDRYNPSVESGGRVSGLSRWLKVSLVSVEHTTPAGAAGTGTFSVWQSGDSGPNAFMSNYDDGIAQSGLDATDGISGNDALWIVAGGHSHYNFGFSEKGRYEVTVIVSAYADDGNTSELGTPITGEPITLYFSVGGVGQLQFDESSYTVDEDAGTATITVERVNGSDGEITVNYGTSNGTATSGSDYTTTSGTLVFADGETSKTITIPILDDATDEADETITLTLSAPGPTNIADYIASTNGDDSNLLGSIATATLTILDDEAPANTAPTVSTIDDATADEEEPVSVDFTVGDAETAAADLVVTATSSNTTLVPAAGLVLSGTGANRTLTVTPALNQFGTATITVKVRDANGLETEESFVVTFDAVNDDPTAAAQDVDVVENEPTSITIVGNDVDGDELTYTIVTPPTNGTLSGTGANLVYTPDDGYLGPDSFTFIVNDGSVDSSPATVNLTVSEAPNVAPAAGDDAFTVSGDNVVRGNVLFNDSDPEGDPLTATVQTGPTYGVLVLQANGSFIYTPGAGFTGTDSFTYLVADGEGGSTEATVAISTAGFQDFEAIISEGHTDVGVAYEDGWDLHIHDEENDVEYEPNGALIYVGPAAQSTRPSGSAFDFIGSDEGSTIYRIRDDVEQEGVPYLGLGTEEIEPGTFTDGLVRFNLKSVNGPGHFSLWLSTDDGPEVLMATSDGITADDMATLLEAGHTHVNWAFTEAGRYEITFQAWGYLDDGDSIPDYSEDVTYYFSVNNLGAVEFASPTYTVTEGGTASITLERSGGSDGPLTVNYGASGGTATAGVDYPAWSGSVTFADGETSKTITFPTTQEQATEANETVNLTLSAPADGLTEIGDTGTATLTITNDDATPFVTLSVSPNTFMEGNSTVVTATLSSVYAQDVTVHLSFAGGATQGTDYTASATSIVIAAGSTTGTVVLSGVVDGVVEGNETVVVSIASIVNGTESGEQQVTATISDHPLGVVVQSTDPLDSSKQIVTVYGTAGNDKISINAFNPTMFQVVLNGVRSLNFSNATTTRVVVYGFDGDDKVSVQSYARVDTMQFGGDGNDRLYGGRQADVLIGGAGKDVLKAGRGRDVVIGGTGVDKIYGSYDDDIVTGNATTFDADALALGELIRDWNAVGVGNSHAERVARLRTSETHPLTAATVINDGSRDSVQGNYGLDWFIDFETSSSLRDRFTVGKGESRN